MSHVDSRWATAPASTAGTNRSSVKGESTAITSRAMPVTTEAKPPPPPLPEAPQSAPATALAAQ